MKALDEMKTNPKAFYRFAKTKATNRTKIGPLLNKDKN